MTRDGSRTAATSKMELFVKIELHLGCCSSPRSTSDDNSFVQQIGAKTTKIVHQYVKAIVATTNELKPL